MRCRSKEAATGTPTTNWLIHIPTMAAASSLGADWVTKVSAAFAGTPPPEGVSYSYGTAGFRMEAGLLDAACLRMGVLAGLRAKETGKVRNLHP